MGVKGLVATVVDDANDGGNELQMPRNQGFDWFFFTVPRKRTATVNMTGKTRFQAGGCHWNQGLPTWREEGVSRRGATPDTRVSLWGHKTLQKRQSHTLDVPLACAQEAWVSN